MFSNKKLNYKCRECGSEQVTLEYKQLFMANTLKRYGEATEIHHNDSLSSCLDCGWEGFHDQLRNSEDMF